MKPQLKTLAVAALFCSTAMVPQAFAQTNQQAGEGLQTAQGEQACDRLDQLAQENQDRFQEEWIDIADEVARQGNEQECAMRVTQAEDALEQLESRQAGEQTAQDGDQSDESRIVVTQPEPTVTVDQDAPEIVVNQAQPQVAVDQARPQIIVRQAQPTVTVEMPRPTITIDQPQPEIIVRMPEPDVSVGVPEPEISVSQTQPEVQVEQGQPQVELNQPEVAVRDQGTAEVNVEEEQPVVRLEQTEQAEVSVDQAQPQVSYESAEPRVEFESAGEPQVQFSQSGEPNIRIERMGEEGGQQGQQQQAAQQGEQAEGEEFTRLNGEEGVDTEQTASTDPYAALRAEPGQEQQVGEPTTIRVSELMGRELVNGRGEQLGTIDNVVMSGQDSYAVLAHGGFLGMGEEQVRIPLERISMEQGSDELIMQGMTDEEIEAMPNFDAENARELTGEDEVEVSSS